MHIFGPTDQQYRVVKWGNLKLWAERGLIRVVDQRDGKYSIVSVRSMLRRMEAIQDMIANTRKSHKNFLRAADIDLNNHMRLLEELAEVCRQAQVQGQPIDESARRDLVRRRPKTVVVDTLPTTW